MANNKKKRDYRSGVTPQFLVDRAANLVDAVTSIPKEIKNAYGKYQKNKAEEEARKAIAKTRYKGQDEDEKRLREAKQEMRNFPGPSVQAKIDKWSKKILENKHRHGRGQKPYQPTKEQAVRKIYLDKIKGFQRKMDDWKERWKREEKSYVKKHGRKEADKNFPKFKDDPMYKQARREIDKLIKTERSEWLIANRPKIIKDLERKSKKNRATKKANRKSKKNSGASSLRKYDKITKISR